MSAIDFICRVWVECLLAPVIYHVNPISFVKNREMVRFLISHFPIDGLLSTQNEQTRYQQDMDKLNKWSI